MKEFHKFLKAFIFVELGSCFATVIKRYLHFINNPGWYDEPWYYGIKTTLVFTLLTVILTTIVYFVVGYIIKKRQREQPDNE